MWGGKPGQVVDLVTERVIEAVTAEALIAEFIVTGDRGLLELATYQDVIIISAEQCLQRSR